MERTGSIWELVFISNDCRGGNEDDGAVVEEEAIEEEEMAEEWKVLRSVSLRNFNWEEASIGSIGGDRSVGGLV